MKSTSEKMLPGSLAFAIRTLTDTSFAASTITPKRKDDEDKVGKLEI